MLESILAVLHNATTLLFGVYISAAFLGVRMNRHNVFTLLIFSGAVGIIYIAAYLGLGTEGTEKIYPLIIHLPLVLFLSRYYKYKPALSVLSVLTAYLCCQISKWVGLVAYAAMPQMWIYYAVRITVTVITFIILIRFVSDATAQLLQKPTRSLLILGLMPLVYYVFDYITGVYTTLLYSGREVVTEFLGFVLCIAYILFLFMYFKQYEEKREAELRNQLMEMKRTQSEKEIEAIKRSQYEISILRHDMRHFLTNISGYIENGETEKAQEFIREVITATDNTATQCYSKNEVVNLILSSYEEKIKACGIEFKYSVQIPEELPYSEVDLTAILSNALENAIHAVKKLPPEKRYIELDLRMKENKLLISIKNTFAEAPELRDGLPVAKEEGHGFGSQSIRYVAEKLHGNCQFSVVDDRFVLRVVLCGYLPFFAKGMPPAGLSGGRQYFIGSERDLHKQGNAAQDNSQRNIKVPADAIPQAAAGLPAAGIDGRKQLVLFHYIEPGNSAQRSADGDDIDGNKIHPRPPLGDGLHTDAEAKAQYGQDDEGSGAAQPGKPVLERFRHGLEHVLQRADPGKDHGNIQDNGKQLT